MSESVALSEAPSRFLDPKKWAELRSFAKSDLIALTFINAHYPDECEGTFERALLRYQIGRALLKECRRLLLQGKLKATSRTQSGHGTLIIVAAISGFMAASLTDQFPCKIPTARIVERHRQIRSLPCLQK